MFHLSLVNVFSCKKVGHKANECRSQGMNGYDNRRLIQYFIGYYFTCNRFAHLKLTSVDP